MLKDETYTRAHWKQKCQQYLYADTIIPCPYEKIAAAICKGDQFITKSEWKVGYQSIGS